MSGPLDTSSWMYNAGGKFYPYEIEQSLRFNDDDSAYLSRTPASAGNRKTWTWSGWVKRGNLGTLQALFATTDNNTASGNVDALSIDATGQVSFIDYTSAYRILIQTTAVFRDPSASYHLVLAVDTTQATSSDRVKLYVNGEQITALSQNTYPPLNHDTYINNAQAQYLGARGNSALGPQFFFDGYMAEVNFIDGLALGPTSFGEFKSGAWIPKKYTGSYGTNGFYLSFADSAAIGDDLSGNANDWTPSGLVAADVLLDSPTENYCVLNAVDNYNTGATLSEGNLKWVIGAADGATRSTFVMTSGKWYAEFLPSDYCGVVGIEDAVTDDVNGTPSVWYQDNGNKRISGTSTSYGATYTAASDIIGLALDLDAGEVTFYKNNVSQGAITLPASAGYAIAAGSGSGSKTSVLNFGQDSSFAGAVTRQGNTDANGRGDFYYAPPAGYLALCTANLPEPTITPALDDVPADYFNTVLYTGNAVQDRTISGVGFQPDFTWIKDRTNPNTHVLFDAIRGGDKQLFSNLTNAEQTNIDITNGFASDGFIVGDNVTGTGATNINTFAYVAWNWKAAGAGVANTDGTISSTVSANQKAGFSIVSYTAPASGNFSVGHGLGVKPSMVISKRLDSTGNWWVWHEGLGDNTSDLLSLNTTNAESSIANMWGTVGRDASVIGFGIPASVVGGASQIAYCFAEVEGYSKFGSYTGNGSADGPFVWCGFRPAFVMVKRTDSTGNWVIFDNKRNAHNPVNRLLYPSLSDAEFSETSVDFTANGFKLVNSTANAQNASGGTYIFMAMAFNPFKYSNAR